MSFRYDKDNLYKEFAEAKKKDIALSKLKDQDAKENDYFTNRVKFCVDHKELKIDKPHYYEHVNINFDNLEIAYRSTNPRDHFYKTVFGMTYAEKMGQEKREHEATDLGESKSGLTTTKKTEKIQRDWY